MSQWITYSFLSVGWILSLVGVSPIAANPATAAPIAPQWYNCRTREVFTPAKQAWCDRVKVLQSATYLVPANLERQAPLVKVTLKNGRYQQPGGKLRVELVNEQNWLTFGDLNGDGKQDAAVILGVALDPNGKALGTFLSAVMDVDGKAQAIAPIWLGERIRLNAPITVNSRGITVPFLTMTEVINRTYVMQEAVIERGKP